MPDIKVTGTFKEYYELLNKRLKYLHDILQNFKLKRIALINKDREFFQYNKQRFSVHNFPINKSVMNDIQNNYNQICRTCCGL